MASRLSNATHSVTALPLTWNRKRIHGWEQTGWGLHRHAPLAAAGARRSGRSAPGPVQPKITKTPFSLVIPRHKLITSALGKTAAQESVQLETPKEEKIKNRDLVLYSMAPYALVLAAKELPGAEVVESIFRPFVELVKTWNLPEWLVHWGHPGNMAVVLFAMGGYGTYLGFRIRLSKDPEEKAKAKDLHPKLMAGMFFFFALGATGGITALLTSDKPIFESPHAVTGAIGLGLLTMQSLLPALFEDNPGLRTVHGLLGSSIMTIFLIHAAFGLQLGLSF